jgi:dTDP-glucose 4,6-dehydratase
VLDKLTYAGNPANLADVEHVFHHGDVADPEAVAEAGAIADAIVNVAAETHVDRSIANPAEFVRTNVLGTQVLVDWARANGLRYVQVSTDEVYGDIEAPGRSREGDPLRPSSPYAAAKAGADLLVLAAVRTHGLDATLTRGSNTYGPNQYPEKLIPLFTTNALDGKPLPVYGDGRQVRDWLHVGDHAAGIEAVLREGAAGEIYNVAGGEEVENAEITRRIVELTGADPALVQRVEDRPGHDRRYALDAAKLHALGWSPKRTLADGLPETVEWYATHRAWWETRPA